MKQISLVLGVLGLLLLIVSASAYLITSEFTLLHQIVGFMGMAMGFFYVYVNIDEVIGTFGSRTTWYGIVAVFLTALCLAVLVMLNFLAHRHPKRYDTTENKVFDLSPQTIQVLQSLESPVFITTFFDLDSPAERVFLDLFEGFDLYTDMLRLQHINPYRNPTVVEQFKVDALDTVVVSVGDNSRHIVEMSEEALTNAIIAVTRAVDKKVCFLQGHGEKSVEETGPEGLTEARTGLQKQAFDVETVKLYELRGVPDDCSVLVAAGPTRPLFEQEKALLNGWLLRGGRLVFMLDPDADDSLAAFLREWGVDMHDDLVLSPQAFIGHEANPICGPSGIHKINESIQRFPVTFSLARSLEKAEEIPHNGYLINLMKTEGPDVWGETDLSVLREPVDGVPSVPSFDAETDLKGPLIVAALVTYPMERGDATGDGGEDAEAAVSEGAGTGEDAAPPDAMLAVFGDSDFISNGHYYSSVNSDLFLNTVSYMAEEEDLLSIRPKDEDKTPLTLTADQGRFVMLLSIWIMPGVPLLLGVYTFIRKRNL